MKHLLLFAITLSAFVSVSSEAVPKSYPMLCRGGGGTLGYSGNQMTAMMYFKKAPVSAGHGLNPGECSWLDRPIGAGEPTCLKHRGVEVAAWIFPDQLHNSYFASQVAPWIRSLLKATNYQTFQVYNPGNTDCFVVTRVGP